MVIVDFGFSFINITPVFDGFPINYANVRIQIGGKLLTNFLKEIVSYRQYNMMDETFLINDIKEHAAT